MNDDIIELGRGPTIKGSRITVYDIMDYYKDGWHHSSIALYLGLSSRQVLAAVDYIENNKAEVLADYEKILERCRRGNPPELQAKLDATHARFAPLFDELRRKHPMPWDNTSEDDDAGFVGGY